MTRAGAPPVAAPGLGADQWHRAAAMRPEERRAAVAAATLPLLLQHGTSVTTRQIAEAAGIAEGTIFRVFADKEAVVQAAVDLAFDATAMEKALDSIDQNLAFRDQLTEAVKVVQRHMADIGRLVTALGAPTVFSGRQRPLPALDGMVALFEGADQKLRYGPAEASRLLCAITLAMSHPALIGEEPSDPVEIVTMFVDGVGVARAKDPAHAEPRRGSGGSKTC